MSVGRVDMLGRVDVKDLEIVDRLAAVGIEAQCNECRVAITRRG